MLVYISNFPILTRQTSKLNYCASCKAVRRYQHYVVHATTHDFVQLDVFQWAFVIFSWLFLVGMLKINPTSHLVQ